jgi:hypothetical protein
MYLDRAQMYLNDADGMERNRRAWLLSCALSPNMKTQDVKRLWRDLKVKQAKTYKPKTEAEAVAELKKKQGGE